MKKVLTILIFMPWVLVCFLTAGCESLRFAPSQSQKQNAWLHNRTAIVAAETAGSESVSEKLQALTQLSELQSRAFTSYFGLRSEEHTSELQSHSFISYAVFCLKKKIKKNKKNKKK